MSVAYEDSISLHPACLQDGKFLVDYYIAHPQDTSLSAENMRFWMEYHAITTLTRVDHTTSYSLVRPSSDSRRAAAARGLYPYRQWTYLSHDDVYIHGPFDFSLSQHGRPTRDKISRDDWIVLHDKKCMYANEPPPLTRGGYRFAMHCSVLFHTQIESTEVHERVIAAPMLPVTSYLAMQPCVPNEQAARSRTP